jgi:glycosyltransferase involved in cell wall biosynthesis
MGEWHPDIIESLLKDTVSEVANKITFHGSVPNLEKFLSSSALCLHCTRGDAFPTSTLESMMAGVPVIVSEWTGTREIVKLVDPDFVVALDEQIIVDRIISYMDLPLNDKYALSLKCRLVSKSFTEENAIKNYQDTFTSIVNLVV